MPSISYTLTANVETLVQQGGADLQGYGNTLANTLYRQQRQQPARTAASAPTECMGGAGNDTYFVDNVGDGVVESAGAGNDTVFSTVNFTLSANVETLILQGSADLQGYGNSLGEHALRQRRQQSAQWRRRRRPHGRRRRQRHLLRRQRRRLRVENAGAGNDTVFSTANFALAADVESADPAGRRRSAGLWQRPGQYDLWQQRQQPDQWRRRHRPDGRRRRQ